MWGCDGTENQSWWIDTGETQYGGVVFVNAGDLSNGYSICLNNNGGASSNGNPQVLWTCYDSKNESYNYDYNNTPARIYPISASGYCVTSNGATNDGAHVTEWACDSGSAQLWHSNGV